MSNTSPWTDEQSPAQGPTILGAMYEYRWLVITVVIGMVGLGYFASLSRSPRYEATTTFLVSDSDVLAAEAPDPQRKVQQEASWLASTSVLSRAADELGGITVSQLREQVDITPDAAVGIIDVTAAAESPERAAAIANAVRDAYDARNTEQVAEQVANLDEALSEQQSQLANQVAELEQQVEASPDDSVAQQRLDAARAQIATLQSRMGEINADAAIAGAGIKVLDRAMPPREPASPKPLRDAAIAGLLGLVIAIGVAYWRSLIATRSQLDPSTILGAPLLARIPDFRRSGATTADPLFDIDAAEAYQFLLASVEYAVAQTGAGSILVTSPTPGSGKSLTSLHLARALAIQGRDVTLVDTDIRARGLTTMLRGDAYPGLVSLAEGGKLEDVIRRYRISQSVELEVVLAGRLSHQPTGLFGTPNYREALSKIIAASDLTIIDSGPLLTVADASAIAVQVAGIVLVLDARTREQDLLKLRERLMLIPTPLLGYVINRSDEQAPASYPYGPVRGGRLQGLLRRISRRRPAMPSVAQPAGGEHTTERVHV